MSVKYRIELGNCGEDIGSDIVKPGTPENSIYRADTMLLTADTTLYTADYNL